MAARWGPIKVHYMFQDELGAFPPVELNPPVYYNLYTDPSEKYNLTSDKIDPTVLSNLNAAVATLRSQLTPLHYPLFNPMSNASLICCRTEAATASICVCGGKKALLGAAPVEFYQPIIPPVNQRDLVITPESELAGLEYF